MANRYCECGCGEMTRGGKFRPGHDQRLLGHINKLLRGNKHSDRAMAISMARYHNWERRLYPGTNRTFGIEIETISPVSAYEISQLLCEAGIEAIAEGYNHDTRDWWKVTTDGSLSPGGIEVVSPPLFGKEGYKQIRTVTRVLREAGCRIDRTCGLHVHHAAHDLGLEDIRRVVMNYDGIQTQIDAVLAPSRRRNSYCNRINYGYMNLLMNARTVRDLSSLSRYHVLNLTSFARYGTIEFRQHQGTLNATKIINWIGFGQRLLDRSRKGERINDFSFLDRKGQSYYEARAQALAA